MNPNYYGNMINESLVYANDNFIFYSNITSDNGRLYRTDHKFGSIKKISDCFNAKYITEYHQNIYYVSEHKIFKYSTQINSNSLVFANKDADNWISDMFIYNDNMYFCIGSDSTILYRLNLESNRVEKITENVDGANITGSHIYYSGNSEKGLFEYNMETNVVTKLIDSNVSSPIFHNRMLFFSDFNDSAFYCLDLKNNNRLKKIIDTKNGIDYFNIISNKLIYEDRYIYCVDLDSFNICKLNNISSDLINILNGEIWFRGYSDGEFKLYKMGIDGSNIMIIR